MVRTLMRLALVMACAAALSMPALAHDRWRGDRGSVVVAVDDDDDYYYSDYGWRRGYWAPGYRAGWRGCDLPPGLAKKYGCYSRPVVLVPRYRYYRPRYYRPRTGVSFWLHIR